MNNLSDICCLLIMLYFNIELAGIILILPNCQGYGTEPVEQLFIYRVDAYREDGGLIKQRLRSTDFQDASFVDDGYAITKRFYVGELV